jgi:hypothetical protein
VPNRPSLRTAPQTIRAPLGLRELILGGGVAVKAFDEADIHDANARLHELRVEMADSEAQRRAVAHPSVAGTLTTRRQIDAAIKLFMAQYAGNSGGKVVGRKLEVIVRDDAGVPDTTRRLAQELVVNDKVSVLAGFGLTPCALAARR